MNVLKIASSVSPLFLIIYLTCRGPFNEILFPQIPKVEAHRVCPLSASPGLTGGSFRDFRLYPNRKKGG